jgi:hypothetical protein
LTCKRRYPVPSFTRRFKSFQSVSPADTYPIVDVKFQHGLILGRPLPRRFSVDVFSASTAPGDRPSGSERVSWPFPSAGGTSWRVTGHRELHMRNCGTEWGDSSVRLSIRLCDTFLGVYECSFNDSSLHRLTLCTFFRPCVLSCGFFAEPRPVLGARLPEKIVRCTPYVGSFTCEHSGTCLCGWIYVTCE